MVLILYRYNLTLSRKVNALGEVGRYNIVSRVYKRTMAEKHSIWFTFRERGLEYNAGG